MNKVILMGNIGKDIEVRNTQSGTTIASFSMATTKQIKGEKKTSWHKVKAFGKTAEIIAQYFTKGSKIMIEGEISYNEWEKDGIKRVSTDIVVNEFHFVDGKKQASSTNPPIANTQSYQPDEDSDIQF